MKQTTDPVFLPNLMVDHVDGGDILYAAGGVYGPRLQPYLQLVIIDRGEMEVQIEGIGNFVTAAGRVTLLKPGRMERFYFSRKEETLHRFIHVRAPGLSLDLISKMDTLPNSIPLTAEMSQLTDWILQYSVMAEREHFHLLCSLGYSAIQLYLTECQSLTAQHHPAVSAAKLIMGKSYAEPITLQWIADKSHVSPEHLIRIFQRYTGMTPMQYLWSFRVNKGLSMLRNTSLNISEIADQTGFKTSFHFSRLVKKKTNVSPTEYRKIQHHDI